MYFGLIMVLGFLICGFVSEYVCQNIIIDKAFDNFSRLAKDTADKISVVLNQKRDLVEKLALADEITNENQSIEEKLKFLEKVNQVVGFEDLAIVDLQGNSYGVNGIRINVAGSSEFEEARQGKTSFSHALNINNRNIFTVAAPIRIESGEIIGVLMGVESDESFTYLINKAGISEEIMVLDSEGEIIIHSTQEIFESPMPMEEMPNNPEFSEVYVLYQRMLGGETGVMECKSPETGIRNYASYAPIGMGWSIVLVTARESVLGAVSEFKMILIMTILIVTILGMIAVYLLASKLSKRMSEITGYLDTVAQGDFEQPISEELLTLGDEVGDAARAINAMKSEIEEMLETIKGCTNYVNEQMEDLTEDVKGEIKAILKEDEVDSAEREIIVNKLNALQQVTKCVESLDSKQGLFKN